MTEAEYDDYELIHGTEAANAKRAEEARAKFEAEKRVNAMKSVMSTVEGRAFFWGIMTMANADKTTFSTIHAEMAREEGRRQVALVLYNDALQYCPELYARAVMENAKGDRNV